MLTSKVCIVGDFAVGKTSLCERFVNQQFSEKYLTTVGVKIDTKVVASAAFNTDRKLVIWDVAGTDRFSTTEFAYLRGAAGYLFVADGTRPDTLATARKLNDQIEALHGRQPRVLLVNKSDLSDEWPDSLSADYSSGRDFDECVLTSAKSGSNVDMAFNCLARCIDRRELDKLQ